MSEKKPNVSVIIPTYNRAHMITRAVHSVLSQTYQDFEIIVVDDGSSDGTDKVIKKFNDSRIKYVRHELKRGASAARNTGIKLSRGKYIAFQDSDDVWVPDKLEKQMNVFKSSENNFGVVFSALFRIEGKEAEYIPSAKVKKTGYIYDEVVSWNLPIYLVTAVVQKKCFDKVGLFDEQLRCYVDKDIFIRIARYYKFHFIDEALLISYSSFDSISQNPELIVKSSKVLYEKHFEEFMRNRKSFSFFLCMLGNSMMKLGNFKEGKEFIIKAINIHPLNLKASLIYILSILGENAYENILKLYRILKRL